MIRFREFPKSSPILLRTPLFNGFPVQCCGDVVLFSKEPLGSLTVAVRKGPMVDTLTSELSSDFPDYFDEEPE